MLKIKVRLTPFMRDILVTGFTSIITVISMIVVTRLLAQGLGPDEFGAYSLARRIVSILVPFSTLAMGVGLARYLGISQVDHQKRSAYILSAFGIVLSFTLLIIIIGQITTPTLSYLIFRHEGYESLFRALLFMLVGFSMTRLLYSHYRGLGRMDLANLWQFVVMACGLLMISVLFAKKGSSVLIVILFGALYMLALPFLVYYSFIALRKIQQTSRIFEAGKELFRYGLPRAPEGLAFGGMLSIGPLLAPHFGSLKDAGFLVVGQSLFRVVESTAVAFGIVALPRMAKLLSEKKENFIKESIIDLTTFLYQIGLFATLHLCLWSDLIVKVWLGDDYQQAIPLMRIIVLALIPYLAYVMLRSVIDAVEVRAINTANLIISLVIGTGVAIFLSLAGTGTIGLAIGTMLGFWTLGILTVFYLRRRYYIRIKKNLFWSTLIINILFILLAFMVHEWLINVGEGLKQLGLALVFEGIFLIIYFLLLWIWKVEWIRQIKNRISFEKQK